jgi:hypothetical protein
MRGGAPGELAGCPEHRRSSFACPVISVGAREIAARSSARPTRPTAPQPGSGSRHSRARAPRAKRSKSSHVRAERVGGIDHAQRSHVRASRAQTWAHPGGRDVQPTLLVVRPTNCATWARPTDGYAFRRRPPDRGVFRVEAPRPDPFGRGRLAHLARIDGARLIRAARRSRAAPSHSCCGSRRPPLQKDRNHATYFNADLARRCLCCGVLAHE